MFDNRMKDQKTLSIVVAEEDGGGGGDTGHASPPTRRRRTSSYVDDRVSAFYLGKSVA